MPAACLVLFRRPRAALPTRQGRAGQHSLNLFESSGIYLLTEKDLNEPVSQLQIKGEKTMSREFIGRALVLSIIIAAFVMATVGSAKAPFRESKCQVEYNKCFRKCNTMTGEAREKCKSQCGLALINCSPVLDKDKDKPQRTQPPRGSQVGQGLRDTGSVGVIQDPVVGGGTSAKDRIRQHIGDLGGAQQLQQSGTPGTPTILRTKKR
jgi:hypothetical protein